MAGPIVPGNIDLHHRPIVHNKDGSISTVRSISIGTDQGEVLIPTVVGGRVVSNDEAIRHFQQTGEHLGIFRTPREATAYAKTLHEQQASEYLRKSQGKSVPQQLARDEAGNVWDISNPSSPRLVSQGQSGPSVVMPAAPKDPPKPEFVPGHPDKVFNPGTGTTSSVPGIAPEALKPTFIPGKDGYVITPSGTAAPIPGLPGAGVQLDAAQRAKAIQQYTYAQQLQGVVDHLIQLNKAGPGATEGLQGLKDYLPGIAANKNFDAAANAARGIVGQTLNFTGGQLNTERESEKAVGPYLPQSSDFDSTIIQKIQTLNDLAASGKQNAIATLGGEPDANGAIHPVHPPETDQPSPASFAAGKTRDQIDPVLRAVGQRVGHMIAAGVSDAKIIDFLKRSGINPADTSINQALQFRGTPDFKKWQRANPGASYPLGPSFYTKQIPMSDARALFNKTAATDVGGSLLAAPVASANAISGGYLNNLVSDPAMAQTGMDLLRTNHPISSLVGDVAGQAALEAAAGLIPGAQGLMATRMGRGSADMLYGAYSGSGESDGNRDVGAVEGGLSGLGFGALGRGVQRGLGGALTGVTNKSLQYLDNLGVPLTLGQIGHGSNNRVGKAIGGIEDRFAGLPGFDAVINTARHRGSVGFNKAAFKGAGGSGATGAAGLAEINSLKNNAYDFLNGTTIPLDAQFAGSQAGVRASIPSLPAYGDELTKGLNVLDRASRGGSITGRDWQSALRNVRADKASIKGHPFADQAGNALGDVESNLLNLAGRQGPTGTIGNLNAANKLNAQVQTLAAALDNGPTQKAGQLFTPGRLDDVSRVNARKYGGRMASLTGANRPFYDLTQAGNEVLPNVIKDSGTAGRMMLVPLALGGLGGGIGAATGGDDKLGNGQELAKYGTLLGLAAAGPYSKAGQKIIQKALLSDRPDQLAKIGQWILKSNAKYAGMFGSSLGRDYFFQPELSQ